MLGFREIQANGPPEMHADLFHQFHRQMERAGRPGRHGGDDVGAGKGRMSADDVGKTASDFSDGIRVLGFLGEVFQFTNLRAG